jgi:hypothetical protein
MVVQFGAPAVGLGCTAALAADSVSNAQRAFVFRANSVGSGGLGLADEGAPVNLGTATDVTPSCLAEVGGEPQTCGPTEAVPVPGSSGSTNRPDLLGATLNPNSNTIDAHFSIPISGAVASDAVVVLSNGQEIQADAVNIIDANGGIARYTFATSNFQKFNEMAVKFVVYGEANCDLGSVQGLNPPKLCNSTGGVPIGDNGGAFGTGYTSGPDPTYLLANKSTGLLQVGFDQRVDPTDVSTAAGSWQMYDKFGVPINPGTGPSTAAVVDTSTFISQVQLTFSAVDVAKMADGGALAICGPPQGNPGPACVNGVFTSAFSFDTGTTGGGEAGTVATLISPTSVTAAFYNATKGRHRIHRVNKKQLKRAIARQLHQRRHRSHRR